MAPSTFASAAASSKENSTPTRDGGSDWPRRPNGATQTFRRTSNAPATATATPHSDATAATPSQPPRYVPPHRNGATPDARYSKGQLLDLYKTQHGATDGQDDMQDLLLGGWQPHATNGTSASGWGRNDHSRDPPPGPDACWEKQGSAEPLGLTDLDDEERELFTSSVNTPLKPPTQNKENQQTNGVSGRKISISHGMNSPGGFGAPSPSAVRVPGRRRETSESYPFPDSLASPTGGFNRDQQRAASPPPSLLRRRTDLKDLNKTEDRDNSGEDKTATTPFGTLKRQNTGPLNTTFGTPGSPWTNAPQSAGFSPMGSFGNFGLGGTGSQQATPTSKGAGLGSGRAESRFKNLLSKDSSEDLGSKTLERKTSVSNLPKVNENESWRPADGGSLSNAPLDEVEEDASLPSGSAALSAGSDLSPPQNRQGPRGFDTPSRSGTRDEFGFGAFGMTSDNTGGFGHGFPQQTPGQQRAGLGMGSNDPMSPTDTNPYKSPDQHGGDHNRESNEHEGHDMQHGPLPGLGGFGGDHIQQHGGLGGLGALPNLGRGIPPQGPASDRSQTSSVGPGRAFPGLGGLGNLGGMPGASAWPPQGGLGTPGRQGNAFGGGLFGNPMGDLQSPSLTGLGAGGGFGGSRMASMFPQGMQDQLRQPDMGGERQEQTQFGGLGNLGGEGDSAFQGQMLGNLLAEGDGEQKLGGLLDPPLPGQGAPQPLGSSASNQPPAPQQRTMVMPDRMRWIYRDPQGQTQGPWSGLEMHDWYKAGFFSPELLVKKAEDGEYEPLAQLIRRIGNSREPFLVPQIGIPHGAASAQGAWQPGVPPNPTSSAGAQPPFASSFPSFGTTLTADQQNALERRKQEEQYLMARQKEHLAQAQIAQRMSHVPGGFPGYQPGSGQGQLQHHSSAQSLHSQPSFGSISSPNAFQPSPSQGAASQQPGFFDNSFRAPQGGLGAVGAGVDSLGHIREEEIPSIMDRLNLGNRAAQASQFGAPGQPFTQQSGQQAPEAHTQQVQQMLQDRARLADEQAKHDASSLDQSGSQAPNERLQHFQQLQGAASGLDARFQVATGPTAQQAPEQSSKAASSTTQSSSISSPVIAQQEKAQSQEPLSLTEQVQKAASAKQSPAPLPQAWAKVEAGIPMPFPPAPSQSPLPAPAAQRTGRQSVADHLHAESRSRSQTPSVDTPSATVAPWAKESTEASKGPSLKQIQEAEAKKAAETELLAVAARRAALQREMEAQALNVVVPAAPGLPSSANWAATGASPATPTSASAWAKAAQPKPSAATAKSMAQIQKEEEARKRRVAAATAAAQAATVGNVPSPAGGKSYANLAGKVGAPAPPAAGGAWTTVGQGGKTKAPIAPVPAVGARIPSTSTVPTIPQVAAAKKVPSRTSTLTGSGAVNAQEEFRKWAISELRPDLNKGLSADEFVASLIFLPPDTDIITEAVHACSSTIDSRHFANEFIRRKKLADKGLVDSSAPPKSASPHNAGAGAAGGGWSEVAKKGPAKAETKEDATNGSFRVVAAKKKGGKR